jgi:hypothetical protein
MYREIIGTGISSFGMILGQCFYPSKWFIFLNDSGIFCFNVRRNKYSLITGILPEGPLNLRLLMDRFVPALKPYYFGQPMTILIGGSFNFFSIETAEGVKSLNPAKLFPWLDMEKVNFKFRICRLKSGKKFIYYSGVSKDVQAILRERLNSLDISIDNILPVTYCILDNWNRKNIKQDIIAGMPGETIYLYVRENKIFLVEKANSNILSESETWWENSDRGSLLNNERANKSSLIYVPFANNKKEPNKNARMLSELLKESKFQLKRHTPFFSFGEAKKMDGHLSVASNALRIAALFITGIALFLSITCGVLTFMEGDQDKLLAEYQNQYEKKMNLQEDITQLENEINNSPLSRQSNASFAGAVSVFCQRRPSDLYLTEITANNEREGPWQVVAQGVSQKENSVFEYRDYISKYAERFPIEVTLLKRVSSPGASPGGQPKVLYNFKLKLGLLRDDKK